MPSPYPSIESILAATRQATGIDPRGGRRNRMSVLSRRVAVYSLRSLRGMSFPEIGQALGVSHSTAKYNYDKGDKDNAVIASCIGVMKIVDPERK